MKKMSLREYKLIPYNGKLVSASELIKLPEAQKGLTVTLLRHRVYNKGMSVHTALATPVVRRVGYTVKLYGETYSSVKELCMTIGMSYSKFVHLLRKFNMDAEKAFENYNDAHKYKTFNYKGKEYRMCELLAHPDNIYGITSNTIRSRLLSDNWNNDEIFSVPKRKITKGIGITYRGETFPTLANLCATKGIIGFYNSLVSCVCNKKREVLLDKILGYDNGY